MTTFNIVSNWMSLIPFFLIVIQWKDKGKTLIKKREYNILLQMDRSCLQWWKCAAIYRNMTGPGCLQLSCHFSNIQLAHLRPIESIHIIQILDHVDRALNSEYGITCKVRRDCIQQVYLIATWRVPRLYIQQALSAHKGQLQACRISRMHVRDISLG